MTRAWQVALLASAVLFVVRWYAASRLGFGDSEALYACYALHPQPVYLDHPGLVGILARLLGGGDIPSPVQAHRWTAVLATLAPFAGACAARAIGASWPGSAVAALSLIATPQIAVGLFGLTPDLLLIVAFYGAVAFAALALASPPGSLAALAASLGAGIAVGLACDAKVSGALLLVGLVLGYGSPAARPHLRTIAPYAGLLVALIMVAPAAFDEIARGYPMLRHRLVDTQSGAGPSFRNLGALLGGQILYVTPPILLGAWYALRDLVRRRHADGISWLLFAITVASLPLVLLSLLSRVAEPHWMAPVYLALPLHLARHAENLPRLLSARLARIAVALGGAVTAAVHAWVLLPLGPRLLGTSYVPRYDLVNDLFAWQQALPTLVRALDDSTEPGRPPPVVIGAHWTICAQVHAALPRSVLVGCNGPIADDFSRWLPKEIWMQAPVLLYVSDDRYPDLEPLLPKDRVLAGVWRAAVRRGGRPVREIRVRKLAAGAAALTTNEGRRSRDP
jgi:hypothetical protein